MRNIRAENNVVPSKKARVIIVASDEKGYAAMEEGKEYFYTLANASEVVLLKEKRYSSDAVSAVITGAEIYMPLKN